MYKGLLVLFQYTVNLYLNLFSHDELSQPYGILCFGPHTVPIPAIVPHFLFPLYPENNLKYIS